MAESTHKHFVEDVGLFFEQMSMPRMAGRILGWLLICDPAHQTAAQLGEALAASKGSISSMTRLLMQTGIVERIGVPGRRENFFRIRRGVWAELLTEQLFKVAALRQLAERGLALVAISHQNDARLQEMHDVYSFMERELPALLERWTERAETLELSATRV